MTITDKLNEIEKETKALAHQAQLLEESARNYEGLLECEVHDHAWKLDAVGSNLRYVQTIQIICERCGCYAMYTIPEARGGVKFQDGQIPVTHHTEVLLRDLIREEDE